MSYSNLYTVLSGITECLSGLNVKMNSSSSQEDLALVSSYVRDMSGNVKNPPRNEDLNLLISEIENNLTALDEMIVNE